MCVKRGSLVINVVRCLEIGSLRWRRFDRQHVTNEKIMKVCSVAMKCETISSIDLTDIAAGGACLCECAKCDIGRHCGLIADHCRYFSKPLAHSHSAEGRP